MITTRSLRASSEKGFTIVELMISLSVLSVLLVLATITMLQIGKLYSKGVNAANVQNATRNIMNDITGSLQFGGQAPFACAVTREPVVTSSGASADAFPTCAAVPDGSITVSAPWGGTIYVYSYCIGTTRYSYTLDLQVADPAGSGQTRHALWRDLMNNSSSCKPLDLTNSAAAGPSDASTVPGSGSELVPQRMTLTQFSVQESPAGSALYTIDVGMAYGDHDLLVIDPSGKVRCSGEIGQEYCGTSSLQTTITRRLK